MKTPMPAIVRAYDAHCEMLSKIFGGGKSNKPTVKRIARRQMTEALFDSLHGGGK